MTVRDAFLWGREHLAASGSGEPAIEAELLLRHAAGWDRAALYTCWDLPLADDAWVRYQALLDERASGRPVHYILGSREFMGLSFLVDERVLIPRPETEVLVEAVIEYLKGRASHLEPRASEEQRSPHEARGPRPEARYLVVDVGTGSGCIAISVAHYVPHVNVVATDISPAALDVAAENARRHGVADRIHFLAGDLLDPLPAALAGRVDVIASNPPYVAGELVGALPREIRDYEPTVAVVGEGDGLDAHRRLVTAARRWLRAGGLLAMEVGAGQAAAMRGFLDVQSDVAGVRVLKDYSGIDRVLTATYQP